MMTVKVFFDGCCACQRERSQAGRCMQGCIVRFREGEGS